VPIRYSTPEPLLPSTACASSSTIAFWRFSSSTWPTSGIITSGLTLVPPFDTWSAAFEDRARLHAGHLG
jgi:hypothetical protein